MDMEPDIDKSISSVLRQKEVDPDNQSIPMMLDLLNSAKVFIDAHRVIMRVAEMMMTGGMQHEGSRIIQ